MHEKVELEKLGQRRYPNKEDTLATLALPGTCFTISQQPRS
jgi:hypothetical protein